MTSFSADQTTPATTTDAQAARKRRLQFRASHRGTKEADLMIGGYVDLHLAGFTDADVLWMEALLDEQDVDIMAWITRAKQPPPIYDTPTLHAMQKLDYLKIPN